MSMSASSMHSPRPASVASCQNSSPRLPSPLNPSLNSFSPPPQLPGHTPRNSPVGEMSDTLSPLRELLDSGFTSSPRLSPSVVRPRTSSFSRSIRSGTSPERSPVVGPIPLQSYRVYACHSSPSNSPFTQGVPFPSSSLSSSLAGPSSSPISHSPRPLSPSNSPRQRSPNSIHSTRSQFHPLCSPPLPTQSRFQVTQGSPAQIIPSPSSRFPRTQSLIQQTLENQHAAQIASSPQNDPRNRRPSLGAESPPRQSVCRSPIPADGSSIQDTSMMIKGDSTPLNEVPVRWWGGRRGWLDDWDNVQPFESTHDPFTAHFSGRGDPNSTVGMEFVQPEYAYGNPLIFREPFGRGGDGPGAFLDEEIHASFDGIAGSGPEFVDPSIHGFVHAQTDADAGYEMDGIPIPRVPLAPGVGSRLQNGYGGVDVGSPPIEGGLFMQKMQDNSTLRDSSRLHGNVSSFISDGTMSVQGQEPGRGHEHTGRRSRRFSNASTRSSTSYVSCMSGPSQSQSKTFLMSPSQSHTSTCPSLSSLGIGIEEAEREERRSRTFWGRRNSGSTLKRRGRNGERGGSAHPDGLEGERLDDGDAVVCSNLDLSLRQSVVSHTHDKNTMKHGSIFARSGPKHKDVADEQAQRTGYSRAEGYVSLAITSILPAATIAMLSPVGEALVKARASINFVGHEIAPVIKDTLSVSADLLSCAPLPGLEEAAKALLSVWNACQKMDTNRLSCMRLAERCATLLYSVRCDIFETGCLDTLSEPVARLCGALAQIQTFLDTQLNRPFLKRYVRREEITRELQACNDAITDAASRFGLSVQIRTYHQVCSATLESRRFVQEAQALLSLDHRILQKQYALLCEHQAQTRRQVAVTESSDLAVVEGVNPPAYGPPEPAMASLISGMVKLSPNGYGYGSGRNTPTLSTLSLGNPSDVTGSTVSLPLTPTPTNSAFIVKETKTTMTTKTEMMATDEEASRKVLDALKDVHRAQDSVDAAADEAALRGTLVGALDANNDMEMVRCLQVARGEIPEAAETLRRVLGTGGVGVDGSECTAMEHGNDAGVANTELDRKFMQGGIDAMMRLTSSAAKQPRGEEESASAVGVDLPSWTITRYEVIRTRKIGRGFFSDVYLGHWRKLDVVVKVLAHSVSREAFVRHAELWNALEHPNVLPLYGASSTVGEKPWFLVSKLCSGDNLAASLKRAKGVGEMSVGGEATVRVDMLRFMYEIAKGMAYLHGCGVLHGDLRAANVLVDENGQCVLSDFGQCEIKLEAHQSCGQPQSHPIRWWAPEMLKGESSPTNAADVYAFAMCCVEILSMGDLPWATLDDGVIHELVFDKDERPPIPVLDGHDDIVNAVTSLVKSCWVREPDHRPLFPSIAASLEEAWTLHGHSHPQLYRALSPTNNAGPTPTTSTSTEFSPAEEQYETASESMRTEVEEETVDDMIDVSLTSPAPTLGKSRSVFHLNATNRIEVVRVSMSGIPERQDGDTTTLFPTNELDVEARNEENYRLIVASNHTFHNSLRLPLWSPTHVEVGAVGYLSKPEGKFITLFNAIDPLQSCDERLHLLPSLYGYGTFEIQRREEGKRSVAQRGFDAISGFLTFKTRGDRSHQERIARQYAFPLVQGKPVAHLYVERVLHRYMDRLEAPSIWLKQHLDHVLEVCTPHHVIRREDLILVVGTLNAADWAVFVSDDHVDGRAQFNVFSGRDKGEPWGMYTVEMAAKNGNTGLARFVDVGQATFASKVSCATENGAEDTVMLAGLRFERGMEVPTVM